MNELTTNGSGPFNPSLRMSSVEIAALTEKSHQHVMRDIRNLVDQGALTASNFGRSEYRDASGKMNPMFELDFEATMTLITGYDARRRNLVIRRWIDLETGKALPAAGVSALDAMASQLIEMVAPAVIDRAVAAITPQLNKISDGVGAVQMNFSHAGTIWNFAHHCLKAGGYNTYVFKDELYEAYLDFCSTLSSCRPDAKTSFFTKLYRAFPNSTSTSFTESGCRFRVVRGMELLPGYRTIIADLRRERHKQDEQELARRRRYYLGITDGQGDVEESA